jgi:hypothetical protein
MFVCDSNEKLFQTLPGQGWRVLVDWKAAAVDAADGMPAATLEPVIAWVTAKVPREKYEDVIIAPLVRWPTGDELVILDSRSISGHKFVFIAPGEELSQQHFDQLRGGYAKAVSLG